MLRVVGVALPWTQLTGRGGTGAYGSVYQRHGVPFDVESSYPRGTLLVRRYRGLKDQGHVAVVLDEAGPQAKVLQSFSEGYPSEAPGVSATYSVLESHAGGYYEFAVLPERWLVAKPGASYAAAEAEF